MPAPPYAAVTSVSAADGGVHVRRQGSGYVLRSDPPAIDVHRFAVLVQQARDEGDDRRRVTLLDRALGLWSGPPRTCQVTASRTRTVRR